ncbi:conserved hypothetical protein [Sinorhizobium medicae]|uniref:Uncharacterized protein n=1 Tax=Sinorhizobium medicae TaxID=110321 RepID=A0A508WR61_9HYPH|nr:conserved hypothetical protein [Sinorhizobium medicae]
MLGFDHHRHAPGHEGLIDGPGDLRRHCLLRLQAAGVNIDDTGDFGKAEHATVRQVGDMGLADNRHHMVLAMRIERDVLFEHDIIVAGDFLEGSAEHVFRREIVAAENFPICLGDTRGRVLQAFSCRIFARPAQQYTNGFFGFLLRRTTACIVEHRKILYYGVHMAPLSNTKLLTFYLSDNSPLAIRLTLQAWVPLAGSGAFGSRLSSALDRPARFPKQQATLDPLAELSPQHDIAYSMGPYG